MASLITLAQEFTFSWTFIQAYVWYLFTKYRTCCQENYVPINKENFGWQQTLTPAKKKNDSTVNYHLLCWWEHGPYFMCSLIIPLSSYMWSLLIPLCLLYVEFTESTVYVLCGVYIFRYLCICGVYWVHCVCYTCKVYLFHCLCYMWSLPSPLSMLYVDFTYSTIFVCVEFTYSTIFVYVEFSYSICLLYM